MSKLHDFTQYFTTTLSKSGGLTAVETTGIVLQSISGVDDYTRPGVVCLTYANPLVQTTAEWITYTSINNSTKELQGVVRGAEGSSAKTHLNGCTIAFVLSKTQLKAIRDRLEGTSGSVVEDGTGLEILKKVGVASAVNEVTVTNAATGGGPIVSATGDDTNIDLNLKGKGTGEAKLYNYDDSTYYSAGEFLNSSIYRQAIINGNFDVWQRGTTMTSVNGVTILADRWKMYTSSTNETNTFSQQDGTGVAGSRYCAKWQRAAGQTGTTGFQLGQSLETQNSICFRGQKLTLSFWAKAGANYSATSGYLSCYIRTGTGTDGEIIAGFTGSATVASQDNVLTTSWQKFTVTTSAVIASSVNQIGVLFNGIPVGTAGADDSLYIAQVQLCAGDVALPFMPKSFDDELRACMRYYEKSYAIATAPGTATDVGAILFGSGTNTTTYIFYSWSYKVAKRTVVAPVIYDVAGNVNKITTLNAAATQTDNVAYTGVGTHDNGSYIYWTGATVTGARFHWTASAEL